MKNFYRILVYLFVWFLIFVPSFSDARSRFWQDKWKVPQPVVNDDDPTIDSTNMESIPQWTYDTTYDKLQWILQFPQRSEYSTTLWYAIRLIQVSINWILWILATVSLIYMLYCWFLIFSSWADDKNTQKGRKWISNAAIALAWIGLSRLIVSVMIWFINTLTKAN